MFFCFITLSLIDCHVILQEWRCKMFCFMTCCIASELDVYKIKSIQEQNEDDHDRWMQFKEENKRLVSHIRKSYYRVNWNWLIWWRGPINGRKGKMNDLIFNYHQKLRISLVKLKKQIHNEWWTSSNVNRSSDTIEMTQQTFANHINTIFVKWR